MIKVDIISGFLGAGKTTLIKKLLQEAYKGERVVLIENEFGEIGIDGGFMQEAGVEITEMNSGCICCSLVGDFGAALKKVAAELNPERIIIEPSGVGKLSDVVRAVEAAGVAELSLNAAVCVADAKKCKMHMKNFGEFYANQVEHAACIILSHTAGMDEDKLSAAVALLREKNGTAEIITTDWAALSGETILTAMERRDTLAAALAEMLHDAPCPVCGHHHEDEHHHEHHHEEHEHHHHGHDEECTCGCHEHHHEHEHEHHHHEHGEECTCGCHEHHHGHDHHGHHHADEVFRSFGAETARTYTAEEIAAALSCLGDEAEFGHILRAKGYVPSADGSFIYFDYVPGEPDVRPGAAQPTGRICVIGAEICEAALRRLFRLE